MTAGRPAAIFARSAPTKSRGGGAARARALHLGQRHRARAPPRAPRACARGCARGCRPIGGRHALACFLVKAMKSSSFCARLALGDRLARALDAVLERLGDARDVERRAGVQHHDVERRAGLVLQHREDHLPAIPRPSSPGSRAGRSTSRPNCEGCSSYSRISPFAQLADQGLAGDRDLVQAVAAVHHHHVPARPGAAARASGCRPGRDGTRPSAGSARRPGW